MDHLAQFTDPVLCVAAHPEDLEIHAGGTIARLVATGASVSYVLCTSGNQGTSDPAMTMATCNTWGAHCVRNWCESQGRHQAGVEPFFRWIAEQLGVKARLPLAEGFRRLAPA